jgi:hypothetical protein
MTAAAGERERLTIKLVFFTPAVASGSFFPRSASMPRRSA